MTDQPDAASASLDDEFERLGRRAGAELRTPPPSDGYRRVERTSRTRRATIATITTAATVLVIAAGILVARREPQPQPQQNDQGVEATTTPPTTTPTSVSVSVSVSVSESATTVAEPAATVVAPTPSVVAPATSAAAPASTPGVFRVLDDSPLAPAFASSATWTGVEAIVLGAEDFGSPTLSAVGYDVGLDQWRRLADPPPALTGQSLSPESQLTNWTGSEVLVSTNQGEVFAYDPVEDLWTARRRADASTGLAASDSRVAVSPRGVLARSSLGWWWYENSTDLWEALPSPAFGIESSMIDALGRVAMVATQVDGSTITSAVFDIDRRTWRNGPPVELVSTRDESQCDAAADGLIVCYAEGYASLTGVVIDPLVGATDTFTLGSHSNNLIVSGIPWITHAWKLLIPWSATWEDLPPLADIDGFDAAVWTGSEIVFFGGNSAGTDRRDGATAAYTPMRLPEQ